MPDVHEQALALLSAGQVKVLRAFWPVHVYATVADCDVAYADDAWSCTCGDTDCGHLAAVRMVTGYCTATADPPTTCEAA